MSIFDPKFVYRDSVETAKPGYLKRRFDLIRKAQKEQLEQNKQAELERILKVRKIGGK